MKTSSKTSRTLAPLSRRAFVGASALAAAAGVAALAGCSSDATTGQEDSAGTDATDAPEAEPAAEPVKLTFCLDYTPNTNHTGVYVALANGYFEEEGLDVEIVQPADGTAEALLGTGQAQFGVSYQDYIANSYVGGNTDFKAIAAIVQHNTSGIMSRAEDGIVSARYMENHVYATWDTPVELATIQQVVEADGGDFSKVEMVPYSVEDDVAGLVAKMYDAVWVYEGWAVQNAAVQGVDVNYFSFISMDDVFDYYTPVLAANTAYAEENPEVAKAFVRAVKRGYEFAIDKPQEAAQILCDQVPELSSELVEKSAEFLAGEYQSDAESWGVIDGERWARFYRWLTDNGLVDGELDENAGWTDAYLA